MSRQRSEQGKAQDSCDKASWLRPKTMHKTAMLRTLEQQSSLNDVVPGLQATTPTFSCQVGHVVSFQEYIAKAMAGAIRSPKQRRHFCCTSSNRLDGDGSRLIADLELAAVDIRKPQCDYRCQLQPARFVAATGIHTRLQLAAQLRHAIVA